MNKIATSLNSKKSIQNDGFDSRVSISVEFFKDGFAGIRIGDIQLRIDWVEISAVDAEGSTSLYRLHL